MNFQSFIFRFFITKNKKFKTQLMMREIEGLPELLWT